MPIWGALINQLITAPKKVSQNLIQVKNYEQVVHI